MHDTPRKNPFEFLIGTDNQIRSANSPYQGMTPKVLFLCSTGLVRSATAAHLFCQSPYFWNTRCAGVAVDFSVIPVSIPLLYWADVVFVMDASIYDALHILFGPRIPAIEREKADNFIRVLDITDGFGYNDAALIELLHDRVAAQAITVSN